MTFIQSFGVGSVLFLSMLILSLMNISQQSLVHLLYIPILLSGRILGFPYGVFAGLIAGLVLGPGNIKPHLFFFAFIGAISSLRYPTKKPPKTHASETHTLQKVFDDHIEKGEKLRILVVYITNYQEICTRLMPLQESSLSQQIHERLKQYFLLSCPCAPYSLVLLAEAHMNPSQIFQKAQKILHTPFHIDDVAFKLNIRCGLAVFPNHGRTLDTLVTHAWEAQQTPQGSLNLYQSDKIDHFARHKKYIDAGLKYGVQENLLDLVYQPVIDLQTGLTKGFEAFSQWKHPKLGIMSEKELMPFIENTTLAEPFTQWLITKTTKQLKQWHRLQKDLEVAINPPIDIFNAPKKVQKWHNILIAEGLSPQHLNIEVSITTIAKSLVLFPYLHETLESFAEKGFKITVDDFGCGVGGLLGLLGLPLHTLKMDPTFVQSLDTYDASKSILHSAFTLAKNMKLTFVIQGVDTEKQYEHMRYMRCDHAQGPYVSVPLSSQDAEQWIKLPYTTHPTMNLSTHP